MRLRTILLLLSLLALLSSLAGGFYYYYSLRESAYAEARKRAAWRAETIRNQISSFLSDNLKTVRTLSGLPDLKSMFNPGTAYDPDRANAMLDHFQTSLEVDVCYLMDKTGLTIASSNRNSPDSFLGQNFSFRPYFQEAMAGRPAKYMALGATSKKRGAYYSHPVYGDADDHPLGVAVIKAPIRIMEETLIRSADGIVCLVGPQGVIFSSNRPDWLYKTLWPLDAGRLADLARSRQFGEGPWPWVGLTFEEEHTAVDRTGNDYLVYAIDMEEFPGWKIYNLLGLKGVSESLVGPLVKTTSWVVLSLCVLAGISVSYLYRKAAHEIKRRQVAETSLRQSEKRYRYLYHNTPAMLHSIDGEGRIVSISDYWSEALGYGRDEVIGRKLTEFLSDQSGRYAEEVAFPTYFASGSIKEIWYQFIRKDGQPIDVLLSAIAERDEAGNIVRSLAVLIDITQRIKAEEELKLAKEKLKNQAEQLERQVKERTKEITALIRNTPAVVYMKDAEGRYILVNSRYEELFGVSNQEVSGRTVQDIFPSEIAAQFQERDLRVLRDKKPFQSEENIPLADGNHAYLSVHFPILDEESRVRRLCGISVEITEIKKAQEKLRRLSAGIMSGQEKERTAIARELHDELGQILTALRMDSVWLKKRLAGLDPQGEARAGAMCDLIDNTITEVGNIATRLRPAVLDDLGLLDALEWHAADFEKRTGIVCVFKKNEIPAVDDFLAIAIYRVAQEALTNVVRHSGASQVEVTLGVNHDKLVLTVIDNGSGFDIDNLHGQDELGIAGMRERANLVGGKLEMESGPEKGTTVRLIVAMNAIMGERF